MKTLINTLLFVAFLPLFAFSQSTTAQVKSENLPQNSKEEMVMPSQTGTNQAKPEKWSEDSRYKVEKRNKKVGKMKVEQCKSREEEKGTGRKETKEICEPKK